MRDPGNEVALLYSTILLYSTVLYLAIGLRARVFYEQIVNEVQPSWLLLEENEGE